VGVESRRVYPAGSHWRTLCSWLKMEAARHSAPAETCVGPSQSALVDHGRLASIVRQHCDFRYCLAATLERFFKGFGVGRQQARIMIANLMRRGLSSISALVRSKSATPAPSLFWPPAPAMERALAHAGGRPLLVAMISSLDGRTRHRPIRAKDAAIAGLRSQPPPTCPAVMEELTGVGWHSFGSLVAAGWTRQGRFKPQWPQIGHWHKFNARVQNRTDLSFELGLGSRSGWPNGAPSLPSSDSHCWGACNE
jgi:hypothetical protein